MHTEDNLPKQRKIVNYIICNHDSPALLEETIQDFISQGYQPYGPFVFVSEDPWGSFYQAMVKYEDVNNVKEKKSFLDLDIESMNLTTRTKNCLKGAGFYKVKDLKKIKYPFHIQNMGTKSNLELALTLIYYFSDMVKYEDEL